MSRLIFVALCFSFLLPVGLSGQLVRLNRLERALGADSVIISNATGVAKWQPISALGILSGSGTDGEVAVWSSGSLTSTFWTMSATTLRGPVTGDPRLENNNDFYTFQGDTDTGMKRIGANTLGLHTGDGTNPFMTVDGTNDVLYLDPNDDGTKDVTISATETSVGQLAVVTPDVGELTINGEIYLTSTIGDTIDWNTGTAISSGDVSASVANDNIVCNWTGYAEIEFSGSVQADAAAFAGSVTFDIYKNGAYTNKGFFVSDFAEDEAKVVSYSTILSVTSGDVIDIHYTLSTSGTMDLSIPTFIVKRMK